MKKILLSIFLLSIFSLNLHAKVTTLKIDLQDSPPKYVKNSDGTFGGLSIELLQLIEKHSDYRFELSDQFIPLKRILDNLEKGSSDIHLGLAKNSERENIYIFGEPLYDVETILISNSSDSISLETIEEVQNINKTEPILGVFGSSTNTALKKQFNLNIDQAGQTIDINLSKLAGKRGRFFTYHNLGLVYKLKEAQYSKKFKIQPVVLRSYQHWMLFSKTTPQETIDDISKVIKELKASGEWAKVTNKYLKDL